MTSAELQIGRSFEDDSEILSYFSSKHVETPYQSCLSDMVLMTGSKDEVFLQSF